MMVMTIMKRILQHGQLQQHSSDGSDYHEDDNEVTTWTATTTQQ